MKKVASLNSLYQLGHIVGQLANNLSQSRVRLGDVVAGFGLVRAHLREMLTGIPLPFEATGRSMKEFVDALDSMKEKYQKSTDTLNSPLDGTLDQHRILDLITRLEVQLNQELDAMPIWFVTKR